MAYKFILKDAFRQLLGRLISAFAGFYVIMLMTPYVGPLRYGDYSTILKYFAIWSALADFGLYVIALKDLGAIKHQQEQKNADTPHDDRRQLSLYYSKFVTSRLLVAAIVYSVALCIAYMIPAYTSNPYIIWGLPLGMIFSASFVASGISQLPFQLYRQMHHVTIAMVIARCSQFLILFLTIMVRFPVGSVHFDGEPTVSSLVAFCLIITSVIASALMQFLYTLWQGGRILPLHWHIDRGFSWNLIRRNMRYGLAYYLSSFHTLIVLILLSMFYPTIQGYALVGMRGLALSFVEMLLIIPPSIANGVMHKTSHYSLLHKRMSYGNLLLLMVWIAGLIGICLIIGAYDIISLVAGPTFLSTPTSRGSDLLLPWFAIVLLLNFIKQVLNYLFVSTDLQHTLLWINGGGVLIGTSIGIRLIMQYGLIGGIITQLLLEVLFVVGSGWIAYQHRVIPLMGYRRLASIVILLCIGGLVGMTTYGLRGWLIGSCASSTRCVLTRLIVCCGMVVIVTGVLSYRTLQRLFQGLTIE